MRRRYEDKNLGRKKLAVIDQVNNVVGEYRDQGLTLTLRQAYYQLVARGLIPNTERSYKNLGAAVTDGRMSGLIDWHSIEDRTRFLRGNRHWDHPADIIEESTLRFRYDLWDDQPERVEVWIEKDALVGVIEQICVDLDVDFFSCRGYVSASEMWAAGQRIGHYLEAGQTVTILHLGDHDPSGVQMTEDIRNRLETFCRRDVAHKAVKSTDDRGEAVQRTDKAEMIRHIDEAIRRMNAQRDHGLVVPTVDRIALTMDQVREHDPPPNPAKLSDSRAAAYVEEHGYESWELDALDPTTLRDLISEHVEAHRDEDLWQAAVARQDEARDALSSIAESASDQLGGRS